MCVPLTVRVLPVPVMVPADVLPSPQVITAAYEEASARFPDAQSPLLALSQLARRRGDRAGALAAIARVFALPSPAERERTDPWWTYNTAQARNADDLLEGVRAPFRRRAQ